MSDFALVESRFWLVFGVAAALIFYGRFYLQWIVSEWKRRSVMPTAFWYMSGVGSFMLLVFGAVTHSPNGTFSHGFNSIIYARNLILTWRERGVLTRRRETLLYTLVGLVVLFALALVGFTWWNEYHYGRVSDAEAVRRRWFWIALGVVGQGLFACRFLVQWLVSEALQKSVIPVIFWHLSLWASLLLLSAHAAQGEWVYAAGLLATAPIYARNLWLIHRHRDVPKTAE